MSMLQALFLAVVTTAGLYIGFLKGSYIGLKLVMSEIRGNRTPQTHDPPCDVCSYRNAMDTGIIELFLMRIMLF